jgi:DHA2 family multidrug resistance protein
MRARAGAIDYVGLGLIALGLGSLELVLDKGQEDDWFHSSSITVFAIVAAASLVAFVVWEWRQKHPVIDVRMFNDRTFATSAGLMLFTGMLLYAPTVLLPAFEQLLMGYTAQQAGETMSPGGFSMLLYMPLAGALVARVDPRKLVALGAALLAVSLFTMTTHLYVGNDFRTPLLLRLYQMAGFGFLFVPINTLVYAGVPPERSNAVAGIMNLGRNMGGSIGIALVTTLIARRSQVHQANLARYTNGFTPAFVARVQGLSSAIERAGSSSVEATKKALAVAYRQLELQATQLAYLDAFRVLAVAALCMLLLLLLTKAPPKQAGRVEVGH